MSASLTIKTGYLLQDLNRNNYEGLINFSPLWRLAVTDLFHTSRGGGHALLATHDVETAKHGGGRCTDWIAAQIPIYIRPETRKTRKAMLRHPYGRALPNPIGGDAFPTQPGPLSMRGSRTFPPPSFTGSSGAYPQSIKHGSKANAPPQETTPMPPWHCCLFIEGAVGPFCRGLRKWAFPGATPIGSPGLPL